MTLREKIEVMEAFERGEEIEVAYRGYDIWSSMSTPSWNFEDRNYRIKPKLKQVVVLETWLCSYGREYYTHEATAEYIKAFKHSRIKLLLTREVEL